MGVGLLLALVFYFDWEGGKVGEALATALRFLFGAAAYVMPVGLICSGLAMIATTEHSPRRHLALGGAMLLGSLSLGYAAGSLGLGPGAAPRIDLFNPDLFMDRGGLVGALEYWAIGGLFSAAGAHLAFLCGISAGVLLSTGTSVGSVLGAVHACMRWCTARVAGERRQAQEDALGFPVEEPAGEYRVEALEPPSGAGAGARSG